MVCAAPFIQNTNFREEVTAKKKEAVVKKEIKTTVLISFERLREEKVVSDTPADRWPSC